jgi:hypothetical protein
MTGVFTRIPLAALAASCLPAPAVAQGPIGTITRGPYVCELPGDAGAAAGQVQAEAGFVIESSSRYSGPSGVGTYLRRGDSVVMTSGPRQGETYMVVSAGFLRRMENGRPGRLRCVLNTN